jgi:hypothetical protein
MGIKLGDVSPLAGALTGKGMFGRGLSKMADSGLGMLVPMSYLAKSQRDKSKSRKPGEAPGSEGMKKGGKVKKMAKGGSTASKRADGCCSKGKTKGRFV